jgi:transposase
VQKHSRLWSIRGRAYLKELPLEGWTARRREDLLKLLAELDRHVDELDAAVGRAGEEHPQARLLMTQPGVGPITSLAFVLTIGDVSRFKHSGQVASYLGLIPREHSSGGKQRLGAISKQGNRFMRQNVGYPEIALIESSPRVPLRGESHLVTLNERSGIQR